MPSSLPPLYMKSYDTSKGSLTGYFLYSDTYVNIPLQRTQPSIILVPGLNSLSAIPILGSVGGALRVALAIIHILGHTLVGVITGKKGHFYHVIKGCTELLRGFIETLPIIGFLFARHIDAKGCHQGEDYRYEKMGSGKYCGVFLVRVWDSNDYDEEIDVYLNLPRASPKYTRPKVVYHPPKTVNTESC